MNSRKLLRIVSIIVVILGIQLSNANGTVVRKLSEEQLVNNAQAIFIGTCTSIRSEWNEEGTKIFTYITITLQTSLKGDQTAQEITIKQLGGVVGEIGMHVDKTSVFEEGEEVLLFLKKGRKGYHRTVGLYQGKFSIETDPASGRKVLLRKKRIYRKLKNGGLRRSVIEVRPDKKIFFDEFTDRVHNILELKNHRKVDAKH